MTSQLPQLDGTPFVTDGGLETDLIFHHGVDLPEFAAFPIVEVDHGRSLLREYYDGYAAVARRAGAGLILETPTWRANPDWAAKVGYDRAALDRVNRASVELAQQVADGYTDLPVVLVSGQMGPRGDGYVAGERADPDEAAEYHRPQVEVVRGGRGGPGDRADADRAEEAIGVVRAARAAGLPVAISFTVETDGRLPDGTPLGQAIERVDADGRAGLLHGQLRPPGPLRAGAVGRRAERQPGWTGSSGSGRTPPG